MRYILPVLFLLAACMPMEEAPTPTTTREFSAPTLAPTATVAIRTSNELYSDPITDGQSNPTAAALPVDAGLPPLPLGTLAADGAQIVEVVLADGSQLSGELYTRDDGIRSPAVLLFSLERSHWASLPGRLLNEGYNVLVMASPNPNPDDIEVLLRALAEIGSVNPSQLAVVAAVNATDAALLGCAREALCRSLVLLSPQIGDGSAGVLPDFEGRPVLAVAAEDDAPTYAVALQLASASNVTLIPTDVGRGTGLLINSSVLESILTFLGASLG